MNLEDINKYEETERLREIIEELRDKKYMLDCGHYVKFGHNLGNNIIIYNGRRPRIEKQ